MAGFKNQVKTLLLVPFPDDTERACEQDLSQDLETGCPKLAVVKYLGIIFFKCDSTELALQLQLCIY